MPEKEMLYRDYASWLTAAEPKFALSRLDRPRFRLIAGWAAGLFVLASLLLWQRMQVVKLGYEVSALRHDVDGLNSVHLRLQRRLQEMESLPNAEKVARERLGMSNLDPGKVIHLKDPGASGYSPWALWEKLLKIFSP